MDRKDTEQSSLTSGQSKKTSEDYHSAGWATIDKNSGVIHVRWWVPLVIIGGAILIVALSCSLIWGYKRHFGSHDSNSSTPNQPQKFESMQDAENAYRDLYKQIDGFCKTVKSPS